jgi:hypothetical protein
MRVLRTEIEIDAPSERVWEVLTDFGAYPEWNPFIRAVEGEPVVGSRLKVRIEPPGARGMTFKPTVRAVEPARELRWLGRLLVPGVFDGEHRLAVEPLDGGGSRFIQSERFSGLLVGPFAKTLAATERGFVEMNKALKQRAEGR